MMPTKAHEDDACFDLFIDNIEYDTTFEKATCKLGFATEIPFGFVGIVQARSSITKTSWILQNGVGIIDAGYRGEWMVKLKYVGNLPLNPRSGNMPFSVGDRVAQVYFLEIPKISFTQVDELTSSSRGEGGFGSSGK